MREVLAAFREDGIEQLDLEVVAANTVARSLYQRWGLKDEVMIMAGRVADLEARLGRQEASSFGSIHVQTDDVNTVEDAVRQFVPRLPGNSRGSVVAPPRHGWITVYDDVCDRNPDMLRRLAKELSDRMGAVVVLLGVERDELVRMILFEHGPHRRRVPLRARVLRAAAAGRRRRARREPEGRLAPDGRRSRGGAPDRRDGARRPPSSRRHASFSPSSRRRCASRAPSTGGTDASGIEGAERIDRA